jgi:uncharacterized metal-binding protein YceD (DUF177 family)
MTSSPFILNVADLLGRDAPSRRELIEVPVDWGLELSTIQPEPPLTADLTLSPLPGGILARGTLQFQAEHTCRRCLTRYTDEVDQSVAGLFEVDPDEEAYAIENLEIDLEPFLRDEALLALPMLPECPDGCATTTEIVETKDSEDTGDDMWRLEDTAQADEVRRLLMAAVEDDVDDSQASPAPGGQG